MKPSNRITEIYDNLAKKVRPTEGIQDEMLISLMAITIYLDEEWEADQKSRRELAEKLVPM